MAQGRGFKSLQSPGLSRTDTLERSRAGWEMGPRQKRARLLEEPESHVSVSAGTGVSLASGRALRLWPCCLSGRWRLQWSGTWQVQAGPLSHSTFLCPSLYLPKGRGRQARAAVPVHCGRARSLHPASASAQAPGKAAQRGTLPLGLKELIRDRLARRQQEQAELEPGAGCVSESRRPDCGAVSLARLSVRIT